MTIHDESNVIRISGALDSPRDPDFFIRSCNRVIDQRGFREVSITFDELTGAVLPNASVPISAVLDHHRARGITFEIPQPVGSRLSFLQPIDARHVVAGTHPGDVLSRVWRFDADSAGPLADAIVRAIVEHVQMSHGVVDAFNWSIWEVIDNVLQHSSTEHGFIEAQVQPASGRLAVCVADAGVGILESLRGSRPNVRDDIDAITLAVQERVTRDPNIGQGNGLWGLYRIAFLNDGILRITSGRGSLSLRDQQPIETRADSMPISGERAGTTVDFQVSTNRVIDIAEALGHRPVNTIFEAYEADGGPVIRVSETARGTGTRRSAAALRTVVLNLLESTHSTVTLDFDGVSIISSSFADELVAKLVSELGFVAFQQAIRLVNLNDVTRSMINRSVALRLAQDQGIVALP